MFELTSGRCENTKTNPAPSSGILFRKKNFWFVHPKRLGQELWNDIFLDTQHTTWQQSFPDLWRLRSASEKSHVDLATHVHPIPKTKFLWVHGRFLWHEIEWTRRKNFEMKFFAKVSKTFHFEIFLQAVLDWNTKTVPVQRWKILEERTCPVLTFCNGEKLLYRPAVFGHFLDPPGNHPCGAIFPTVD